jgi:hypothetical protein
LRSYLALVALIIITLGLVGIFAVDLWYANELEGSGQVHFPISCSDASQRQFDFATTRLHTLRFNESERAYVAITEAEPDCAIAYWGVAMSRLRRPVAGFRAPEDLRAGRTALRSATLARTATPRERAYIAALLLLFQDGDSTDWHDRTVAYEHAMEAIAAGRDDMEAIIFYALALNLAALPSDRSFRRQTKAAELLLAALQQQPHHPGLAHYLTYCLRAGTDDVPSLPTIPQDRFVSSIQGALAGLAMLGVGIFFIAVWPVWHRAKNT